MSRIAKHLKKAFSLTEVTIALGIIGFCAIAVMGLLPIAVQTHRRGHDQTQATSILGNFLAGFQAPITNSLGYQLSYPFTNIGWTTNGAVVGGNSGPLYFDAEGNYMTNVATGARYILRYTNFSAPSGGSPGMVNVTVSWPSQGTNKYQGTVGNTLYFTSPVQ